MAKEWARFGNGQFMQQATSPQQHTPLAGRPNGIQLPHPPLPHLPLSPFSPLLQYVERDRQLSPSYLLHGKPMPLACSPSPNPSPNHLLPDRLQSPSSPFLRHNHFAAPSSPSDAKFGGSSNDLRRLSIPTPPIGLPYHMSPGGRSSASPVQPTPLWRSSSNPTVYPEVEKGRSGVSSQDVQDRLHYLAQQRSWQKDQGRQPEVSLRMGFGGAPHEPSPERSSSLSSVNGQYGSAGGPVVPPFTNSPSCKQPSMNKPLVNPGYKRDVPPMKPVSRNDVPVQQYRSHQLPPSSLHLNQSVSSQQRQPPPPLPTPKDHIVQAQHHQKVDPINGYDSKAMDSRLKMSDVMSSQVSAPVMTPSRQLPSFPHNGVAFAKSSAPTLQHRKQISDESPRKNPDTLSREREQQILADIQKRFSLPSENWKAKQSESSKQASNNTSHLQQSPPQKPQQQQLHQQQLQQQQLQQHPLPEKLKVKKKRKKKMEMHSVKPVPEEGSEVLKTVTPMDPMFEKYPIYSQIMASFINASNKSGLSSPYSCLKKNNNSVENHDSDKSVIKKKKKKKLKLLKEKGREQAAEKSLPSESPVNQLNTCITERTGVENSLPSIAGFAFLQKDSADSSSNKLHVSQYSNIPTPGAEASKDCGYNVQTYNSVLSKLQDQLKSMPDPGQNSMPSPRTERITGGNWVKENEVDEQSVQKLNQSSGLKLNTVGKSFSSGENVSIQRPDHRPLLHHITSAGAIHMGSNNSSDRDCQGVENRQSANHPLTHGPSTPLSKHSQNQTLSPEKHSGVVPGDKSVMCCDTCHKVGKQDSYLCSSHKVLFMGCDKRNSYDPSSVLRYPDVQVKMEHNEGHCDSSKVDSVESSRREGGQLYPQTESLQNNHYPRETSAEIGKDVAFICDEQDRMERLKSNAKIDTPACNCLGPDYQYNETVEGPFYTQLGAASSLVAIRNIMEDRFGYQGSAIRIEKVKYTGREGKSSQGCPIAKWILRRSGPEEKVMCVVKHRSGHFCPSAYIIVAIVAWEGIPPSMADEMYEYVVNTVTKNGFETDRRCGTNEAKTCACQGWDLEQRGASFSFGCSWSMYFNGCKFARSRDAKKFKLKDTTQEEELEAHFQRLATHVGPLYQKSAPESYNNQIAFEEDGTECRLGYQPGRPFSGVTTCMDFCAHAHKDLHNMNNGSTVVVTLTRHRGFEKPDDEQLHVLPLYILDSTDEFGSEEGLYENVRTGSLEVLQNFPMEARIRAYPLTPKKRGKGKKDSPSKKETQKIETPSPKDTDASIQGKQLQYQMMQQLQYQRHQQLREKMAGKMPDQNLMHSAFQNNSGKMGSQMGGGVPQQGHTQYDAFYSYFDKFGTFPPQQLSQSNAQTASSLPKDQQPVQQQLQNCDGFAAQLPGQGMGGSIPAANQSSRTGFHNNHHRSMDDNPMGQPMSSDSNQRPNGLFSHHATPEIGNPWAFPHNQQNSSKDSFRSESGYGVDGPSPNKKPYLANHQFANHHHTNPSTIIQQQSSESPLHLLSEAVSIRTKAMDSPVNSMPPPGAPDSWAWPSVKREMSAPETGKTDAPSYTPQPLRHDMNFSFGGDSRPDCADGCMRDSNFLSAEMEYNEDSFLDPQIGGVAVALTHGSVYFEVAKRELHATTALRRPNRKNPTRVSLVFYQHKNMNLRHHGWYENERKAELMRQRRLEKMKEGVSMDPPNKPGPKKKKKKSEEVDFSKTSAAKYKYLIEAPVDQTNTMTTDSIIVRWIDPQPMVTGPYQRWVSH